LLEINATTEPTAYFVKRADRAVLVSLTQSRCSATRAAAAERRPW
jgi:hypothetical protein